MRMDRIGHLQPHRVRIRGDLHDKEPPGPREPEPKHSGARRRNGGTEGPQRAVLPALGTEEAVEVASFPYGCPPLLHFREEGWDLATEHSGPAVGAKSDGACREGRQRLGRPVR
eukprot:gene13700-biopygen9108